MYFFKPPFVNDCTLSCEKFVEVNLPEPYVPLVLGMLCHFNAFTIKNQPRNESELVFYDKQRNFSSTSLYLLSVYVIVMHDKLNLNNNSVWDMNKQKASFLREKKY